MRIDYTLPALEPGQVLEAEQIGTAKRPSFRDRLTGAATVHLPRSLDRVLHLDAPPLNASFIGPPPRPQSLDTSDAESEHARWRSLLLTHFQTLPTSGGHMDAQGARAVQTMLAMLIHSMRMEDAISSRSAAITRG